MEKESLLSLQVLLEGEGSPLGKVLNTLAATKRLLGPDCWVGAYFYCEKKKLLLLGPFEGTPACVAVRPGKGVVGECFLKGKATVIPDVRKFPGYISCDPVSKSEFVAPLYSRTGKIFGVFDVDSSRLHGLDQESETLERISVLMTPLLQEISEAKVA